MYVPPYALIKKELSDGRDFDATEHVTVSKSLFVFLLRKALEAVDFDQDFYQKKYPDIERALKNLTLKSARQHFVQSGYFEGRSASDAVVDEEWYLVQNADVRNAVRSGLVKSGAEHFNLAGWKEWRVPNPDVAAEVDSWKKMLTRS